MLGMSDPLNWTKVTRVTIDHQGDLGDEIDQSDQGDEDYQGVLGCTGLYCAVLGLHQTYTYAQPFNTLVTESDNTAF